ncbi:MAG: hypothetical protein EAY65_07425 [Alphaproteobacteria bacterium]|nr:MAG: hypothetical protein EAY65_07425 [Alphaproteobacteria bacterium]
MLLIIVNYHHTMSNVTLLEFFYVGILLKDMMLVSFEHRHMHQGHSNAPTVADSSMKRATA